VTYSITVPLLHTLTGARLTAATSSTVLWSPNHTSRRWRTGSLSLLRSPFGCRCRHVSCSRRATVRKHNVFSSCPLHLHRLGTVAGNRAGYAAVRAGLHENTRRKPFTNDLTIRTLRSPRQRSFHFFTVGRSTTSSSDVALLVAGFEAGRTDENSVP